MARKTLSRRQLLAAIPGTAALVAGVACGDDDDAPATMVPTGTALATSSASAAATTAAATTAAAVFPRTIAHKYGKSEIKAQPTRVVSVGYSEQDTLLAMGIKPVGVRDWYGDYPNALWPWAQAAAGDAKPQIIGKAELNLEAIAALKPDVIIGITSGMTLDEYTLLAKIAPTIPQTAEFVNYGVPWRNMVTMMGQALGLDAKAAQIIKDIDALYTKYRNEHPEFKGKTVSVAFYFSDKPGAYSSQDSRSRVLTDLGFTIPPKFDQLAGSNFYFSVSNEEITTLDTDVIVWIGGTDAAIQTIKDMPLRSRLTAAQKGREIFLDVLQGGAFSFGSPLSLPFFLEKLVPQLAAAAKA